MWIGLAFAIVAVAHGSLQCATSGDPIDGYTVTGRPGVFSSCFTLAPLAGASWTIFANITGSWIDFVVSRDTSNLGDFVAFGVAGFPGGETNWMPDGHAVMGKCSPTFSPQLLTVHLLPARDVEADPTPGYVASAAYQFLDCTVSGTVTFGFRRTLAGIGSTNAGDVRAISTTGDTQVIYSSGPCQSCTIPSAAWPSYHMNARASATINVATGSSSVEGIPMNKQVHGGLMGVGWGIILPFGAFIARYTKPVGPFNVWPARADPKAWQVWFIIHFIFQHVGLIIVSVGIGYAAQIGTNTFKAHRALGGTIMTLGYAQFISGWLRPHKEPGSITFLRVVFEYIHKNLGRFAVIMAVAQIQMGMDILPVTTNYLNTYSAGVAVLGGICVAGELLRLLFPPKSTSASSASPTR